MNRVQKIGVVIASSALFLGLASSTFASSVPPVSTGQPGAPNVTCGQGNAVTEPNGFLTGGFAKAGAVYAGSTGTASFLHSNSTVAVAQYDVACLQLTSH